MEHPSEDSAHNSLQMSSSRDLTDVTLVCEGHDMDKFKMQCEGGRL